MKDDNDPKIIVPGASCSMH